MRGISIYRNCGQAYPGVHKNAHRSCTNLDIAKSVNKKGVIF